VRRLLPLLLLIAVACWEQPIEERLTLDLSRPELYTVQAETTLRFPDDAERHPGATARVAQRAREIVEGRDPWHRSFEAVGGGREQFVWTKESGRVSSASHVVTAAEPAALAPVLEHCGLGWSFRTLQRMVVVELFAVASSRVSDKERGAVKQQLEPWIAKLERYNRAALAIDRHLEANPQRAHAVFGGVFGRFLEDSERDRLPQPNDEEQTLLDQFDTAAEAVLGFGSLEPDAAETLNERVMAAFSPFCGEVRLVLPRTPTEVLGFTLRGELPIIPAGDLYEVLQQEALSVVHPDPLVEILNLTRFPRDAPFDLQGWLQRARRSELPRSSLQLLADLEQALQRPGIYRVSWDLDASVASPTASSP
jgi:hypothetical protein